MVGKRQRLVRRRPEHPRSEREGLSGWRRSPWAGGEGDGNKGDELERILYPRAPGQKNREREFIRTETEGECIFVVSALAFVVSLEKVCSRGPDRLCPRKPSNTYYKRRLLWHRSSQHFSSPLSLPSHSPCHSSLTPRLQRDPSTWPTSTWVKSVSALASQVHPRPLQQSVRFKIWTPEAKKPEIHPLVALPRAVPTRTSAHAVKDLPQRTLVALAAVIP